MKQVVASLEGQLEGAIGIEEQELLPEAPAQQADSEELRLIERLREGDETAFTSLVDRHHGALIRLARAYVSDHSIAEEVVQETWIAVLEGLHRFEGRSSLKTWIFRI